MSAKLTRKALEVLRDCDMHKIPCSECLPHKPPEQACYRFQVERGELAALALRLAEALLNLMIEANADAEMNANERACSHEEYTEMTNQPAMLAARSLLAELEG